MVGRGCTYYDNEIASTKHFNHLTSSGHSSTTSRACVASSGGRSLSWVPLPAGSVYRQFLVPMGLLLVTRGGEILLASSTEVIRKPYCRRPTAMASNSKKRHAPCQRSCSAYACAPEMDARKTLTGSISTCNATNRQLLLADP